MMHPTHAGIGLARLGDSDFVPANPEDYLCGKEVYDPHAQRRGPVHRPAGARGALPGGGSRGLPWDRGGALLGAGRGRDEGLGGPGDRRAGQDREGGGARPLRHQPPPSTTKSGPRPPTSGGTTATPRCRSATPRAPPTTVAATTPRFRSAAGRSCREMVRTEAATTQAARPEASVGANPDAVWGARGVMARDILPEGPTKRRRRSKLCALRAVDKLGPLGEGNLLAALADRPRLRWSVDEEGARWAVLAQLGRIGDPWGSRRSSSGRCKTGPVPRRPGTTFAALCPAPTGSMKPGPRRAGRSRGRRRRAFRVFVGHMGRRRSGDARSVLPRTIPPADEKGTKVAWAVARLALVMVAVVTLLSVVLPP